MKAMSTVAREQDEQGSLVGNLVRAMLRHPWAWSNCEERISVEEALGHACWPELLEVDVEQGQKKVKFVESSPA
jgi:hypothetical protein